MESLASSKADLGFSWSRMRKRGRETPSGTDGDVQKVHGDVNRVLSAEVWGAATARRQADFAPLRA